MELSVSMQVFPETPDDAIKAVEAMSRVATGLGFDGLNVTISVMNLEEDVD